MRTSTPGTRFSKRDSTGPRKNDAGELHHAYHSFEVVDKFRKWAKQIGVPVQAIEQSIDRWRGKGLDHLKAGLAVEKTAHQKQNQN